MSSASKLTLFGLRTALFRTLPPPSTFSPFFLRFHHRRRSFSSATAATETLSSVSQQHHHPWPEWVSFVDTLNTKGYITKPSSSPDEDETVYVNINLLKDPCLSFARDRYDIFKSLSLKDIQGVVEGGCPNLLRKAVNSAKRLRVHVRLDEGDVCGACNLRDSCDRAYVILKEFEADARTVDIVRILLFYALDPLVLSGGEKPPVREAIESSARKLLSQLVELSESSPAPAPAYTSTPSRPKPTTHDARAKGQPPSFMSNRLSKDVEMKKGDWMCPKCNFMNFSRNTQCRNCNEHKPEDLNVPSVEMKKGDWICPECSFMNFSRNTRCLKCKTDGPPKTFNTDAVERKKGDWTCSQCGFMNYASNAKCLRCPELRPKTHPGDWNCPKCDFMNFSGKLKCFRCQEPNPSPKKHPGDWSCPKCDFYNYSRNMSCLKCNTGCPKDQPTSEYEEHMWRGSS
ncbi:hypothetical protein TanjilG_06124 [Lupinus angustifolius]|uniref:RanBP2-type domain-containing protein n=1 Tax=Lupinus angustifolius TaxID=3871 RepID=A0A1J7GSU8_LUPAN|nr:PREDICTED: zinc finger protein VAR3, chloroplastic-like [Lupinus angustifolius]OIW03615.1 hypothetical protein TanjilG_06124 [Lupinus angustifolius]